MHALPGEKARAADRAATHKALITKWVPLAAGTPIRQRIDFLSGETGGSELRG